MKETVIGIIGAMQKEVDALKEIIQEKEISTYSGIEYVQGYILGKKVVIAKCGVGKVFAAVCAQTMILKFSPNLIINVGVGGSLTKKLDLCDIAIADKVVQYDMDTSAVGDPVGLISGINKVYFDCDKSFIDEITGCIEKIGKKYDVGVIATGDKFISDSKVSQKISQDFGAIVCEMEGASIGHVCFINDVPFGVVRIITDTGSDDAELDYFETLDKACLVAHNLIMEYLK